MSRPEPALIIDPGHNLVKLAKTVSWDRLDEVFCKTFCPDNGRPAVSTRLMVSRHYLKCTFNLSDDDVVAGWVENPIGNIGAQRAMWVAILSGILGKIWRWSCRIPNRPQGPWGGERGQPAGSGRLGWR